MDLKHADSTEKQEKKKRQSALDDMQEKVSKKGGWFGGADGKLTKSRRVFAHAYA
jgi:hypothetical protein